MSRLTFACSVLASLASLNSAGDFLHTKKPEQAIVLKSDVEDMLLSELAGFDDSGHLKQIEDSLRPMYAALPKREGGSLDFTTVRYALHRYFVHRHGWYVAGLEQSGSAWNSTTPTTIMKDRTPSYIQSLFAERLHGGGFGLHELAVFAATLSDLIHKEAVDGLASTYKGLGLPVDRPVPRNKSFAAVRGYLGTYFIGGGIVITSKEDFKFLMKEMPGVYPAWRDTTLWVQDLRNSHDLARKSFRNPFVTQMDSFEETSSFLLELGHRFGSYQNLECSALKNKLVDLEYQGTGRVPLSRFYAGGAKEDWQFKESVDYLRNMGALDETDASRPSVVIPNYLTSQSNCLSSSKFYSVCCSDECEPLRLQLEKDIAMPTATPARIAAVVASMHSDTVVAPRNLSSTLTSRLEEIAYHHGGEVPMHGRLFSQWMHHVYPRECPFPHVAGTTNPLSPDEWMDIHGIDGLEASEGEMLKHNSVPLTEEVAGLEGSALPWTFVEELVGDRHAVEESVWAWSTLRPFMAGAALLSFAVGLLSTCAATLEGDAADVGGAKPAGGKSAGARAKKEGFLV